MSSSQKAIVRRTKQMTGVVGLLAALALAMSGCSVPMNPGNGKAPAQPASQETQAPKISSMKLVADGDFEGWNSMDGETNFKWSAADKASMEKNGTAVLQILAQNHPEFTVDGFKPTAEIWNDKIAPELKPLTTTAAWPKLAEYWMKEVPSEDGEISGEDTTPFGINPFLTNRPEILEFGTHPMYNIIRSWKTPAGEKCSPSDKPYDVNPVGISATTRPEGNSFASAYPLITGMLEVVVHCKEGGTLKVDQMSHTLQMKKEGGEWLLSGVNMFAPSKPNVMEK
jgi:hypothetical protein